MFTNRRHTLALAAAVAVLRFPAASDAPFVKTLFFVVALDTGLHARSGTAEALPLASSGVSFWVPVVGGSYPNLSVSGKAACAAS